jgi:hypothetical protein
MHRNNKPIKATVLALFLLFAYGVKAKNLPAPTTPANYVHALQVTNSFLWAWVNRDADAGRRFISRALSSKLQNEKKENWFRDYMVGVSNPHHHSFEISSGKTINSKRISFPVILYEHYTGEPKALKYKSRIEIVNDGDSWRVDILPITSE